MITKLVRLPGLVGEYFFSSGCGVCGGTLLSMEETWYGLCADCQNFFTIVYENRCSLCGRPLISETDRCLSCRNGALSYVDQGAALFPYTGNYRNLLRAYKFEGCRRLGNFLAEKILEGLSCFSAPLSRDAVLVPVPPKPGKLKKIGWDQIDYIAKILKRRFRETRSFRVYPCLKRLSFQSQKGLNREDRKTNLLGRIRPVRKAPREAVLFDDVITTGATLDACAAALKDGGAEKVYGICLFY